MQEKAIREKGKSSLHAQKEKEDRHCPWDTIGKGQQRTLNPGSAREKCIYQGMSGFRSEQASQIHILSHRHNFEVGALV